MAVKKTRVVDKWKAKKWYNVLAPVNFDSKEIAEVVSSDEALLQNRLVKVSLMDVLGNTSPSAMFTSLYFRITDVKAQNANTKLIGHEIAPSFLKSIARRGRTLLHKVVDITTKDNESVRIKVIAVANGRISENTRRNLRAALEVEVNKGVEGMSFDEVMSEIFYGKLVAKVFNAVKNIASMKRIEVRKTERKETFNN